MTLLARDLFMFLSAKCLRDHHNLPGESLCLGAGVPTPASCLQNDVVKVTTIDRKELVEVPLPTSISTWSSCYTQYIQVTGFSVS